MKYYATYEDKRGEKRKIASHIKYAFWRKIHQIHVRENLNFVNHILKRSNFIYSSQNEKVTNFSMNFRHIAFEIHFQSSHMRQSIQEWNEWNLWRIALKNLKGYGPYFWDRSKLLFDTFQAGTRPKLKIYKTFNLGGVATRLQNEAIALPGWQERPSGAGMK